MELAPNLLLNMPSFLLFRYPKICSFDTSCFDGHYVTGDIDDDYLENLRKLRNDGTKSGKNKKYLKSFSGGGGNDIQSGGGF